MTSVKVKYVNKLWWPKTLQECQSIEAVGECLECAWRSVSGCGEVIGLLESHNVNVTFENFNLLVPRKKRRLL